MLVPILLCLATAGFSQRQYFILVESENRQPIYVRIGETTFNSSSIGHVIIPALSDSVYLLEIGFASDQSLSNQYSIRINKKDHGYQLKKLNDKGWVLFNFQTLELVSPIKKESLAQSGYSLMKRDDGFAKLFAQVVNDTAVLYSIVYQKPVESFTLKETKPTVDSSLTKKQDNVVAKKEETKEDVAALKKEEPKKGSVEPAKELPKPLAVAVTKVQETQLDSGKYMVYLDEKDSVKIFISAAETSVKTDTQEVAKETKKVPPPEMPSNKQENVVVAGVSADGGQTVETIKKQETSLPPEPKKETKDTIAQTKKLVLLNSDCKALAWDNDVDKIRLKMLAEKDVDNKINIARKVFKTKCFSAAQVKGLTELFTNDQDKYKFLDAAYPFVFDTENFKQLSYLLTDEYYIKRFRTMVRLE
jgi:hypothetical protein